MGSIYLYQDVNSYQIFFSWEFFFVVVFNREKKPKGLEVREVEKVNKMEMLWYEAYLEKGEDWKGKEANVYWAPAYARQCSGMLPSNISYIIPKHSEG